MKFYYLIIPFLFVNIFASKSQVGINTQSPQGVFHVDSQGDTSSTANSSDDFTINPVGYAGIGTVNPTASLDIVGDMRITDGTEYDNYVMTSDASGTGSWKRQTYTSRIIGSVPATLASMRSTSIIADPLNWTNTGASITLPAGNWMIFFYCIYNNPTSADYTIWWDLCSATTWSFANGVGRVLSYFAPSSGLSPTYASYAVSPTATTTYYVHGLVLQPSTGGPYTYNSGARIWAIPVF